MPLFVAAIVLGGASIVSTQMAARQQRKAAKTEAKQAAVSNRRERIQALAKSRVVRSQQLSSAEALGTSGDSGVKAAIGAQTSATYSNVGFQQQLEGLNNRRVGFLNKANQLSANAQTFGQLSSAASFADGGSGNVWEDIGKSSAKPKGTT